MGNTDMATLFREPPRLPLIAPSILSADFARMGEECRGVLDAGADLLHLDVMDGHFVPNLTMGPDMCRALRGAFPDVFLDVHLMVTDPARFVEPFVRAGADHLTFHMEAVRSPKAGAELASLIRAHGLTAGLAVNPPTSVGSFTDYLRAGGVLESIDLVLVMSVNPGFSGQAFIPEVLEKARVSAPLLHRAQRLEIDGGITNTTSGQAREAGIDVLVAASAIFGHPPGDRGGIIRDLRAL